MVCVCISSAFEFFSLSVSRHEKFMVGFSIQVNEKTNHKFPVTGYGNGGKFERRGNPLYSKQTISSSCLPYVPALKLACVCSLACVTASYEESWEWR